MSSCGCSEAADQMQGQVLKVLLAINAVMFLLELVLGLMAESTGLLGDSLDMLADALVYGIALSAVGGAATAKQRAARWSGVFQIVLGLGVLVEVVRRMIYGSEPQSLLIIGVGFVALLANLICLALIAKHRHGEAHMRASWIFSANDVLANLGVILSGALVWWLGSYIPDLIAGTAIAALVIFGGVKILRDSRSS